MPASDQHAPKRRVVIHVDVESMDNLTMRASSGEFEFFADEPIDAGGSDQHPYPLHYLAAGVGTCLLSMIVRYGKLLNVDVSTARCRVTAEWETKGSVLAGTIASSCRSLRTELHIESTSDLARVAALVRNAEAGCHARSVFEVIVPVQSEVMVNGHLLDVAS